jgi:hypothetical protein
MDLQEPGSRLAAGRTRGRLAVRIAAPLIVFIYLTFIRTRGISQTFLLLGNQILSWRIALGSWRELPIGGGPSSVGGTTPSPVFCWVPWAIRHVVGPWTRNLAHAGGSGLSVIQSAADALLLAAIWKRFASLPLALAVTLFIATAPFDMALSASIWNPPLAVAMVKATIALALLGESSGSIWWSAGATASAVLAVQAHSSAVFFAAPVIASFTARELFARRVTRAWQVAGASAAVILLLELPYLQNLATHPGEGTSQVLLVNSVTYTLAHPQTQRPGAAFRALVNASEYILLRPWTFSWLGTVLVTCRAFDHYWFLAVAPSAALTIAPALTAWRPSRPAGCDLARGDRHLDAAVAHC